MSQVEKPKDPRFWRSVEDYKALDVPREKASHGYPELVGREFPVGATEMDGATRRDFLKLIGLTAAGTVASGCMRNPPERILPFARQPADIRPGIPLHYATSMSLDGFGMGLLVTAREGRPIKVEGNPDHPSSFGASGTFEQGLSYGVYDPQRGKTVKRRGQPAGWKSFLSDVQQRMPEWKATDGAKVFFLEPPTASPFDIWLRNEIKAELKSAHFHSYAAVSRDAVYEGTRIAFGSAFEPRLDFHKARVILSLDDDFLEDGPDRLVHARDFAAHRVPEPEGAEGAAQLDKAHDDEDEKSREHRAVGGGSIGSAERGRGDVSGTSPNQWMNRLYMAECGFTVTGAQADHRLRVRGSEIVQLAAAIYAAIVPEAAADMNALAGSWKGHKWVNAVAKDLKARSSQALVTVGPRQPAAVHALVAALNSALGSDAVRYSAPALVDVNTSHESLQVIIDAANRGEVDTLVITAWNPVYTAPADLKLAEALRKIPNVIYHGQFEDETASYTHWYLPATHELESWGDSANPDGVVAVQQPLIAPLFNGIQRGDLLGAFFGKGERGAHSLLRDSHASTTAEISALGMDAWWERVLQKGVLPVAPPQTSSPTVKPIDVLDSLRALKTRKPGGIELNLVVDNKVYDGRFGDNAWLQELPGPLTKVVWGNVAMMSPATAERLGLESEQIVELGVGGNIIEVPIFVLPGHADDALSLAVGYGREGAEAIARGVGSNAYKLRTTANLWFGADVKLSDTGKKDRLGITQEHWAMEGRPIALVSDLTGKPEMRKRQLKLIEEQHGQHRLPSMHDEVGDRKDEYTLASAEGYLWAMAIDMSKCTGCNACILACESENNILIVGKDQVRRGREMHWLRIDRYFEGDLADPQVVTQPMACVQCEKAPCEYVCPVNATVHSDEGLNDMVYNRCVGTRYCANNCPYKVRRFNYLNWHNNLQGTLEMKMNPDVTVRARGVIEKCTYCVQRIEQARIATRIENKGVGRVLRDGEVITACQQSCASNAITFGSLHDKKSEVSKKHNDERAYQVLWELNTRPRTRHLAKVRNLNPELA